MTQREEAVEGDEEEKAMTRLKAIETELAKLLPVSSDLKIRLDNLRARAAVHLWRHGPLADSLRQSRRLDYECGVHGESIFRQLCRLDGVEGSPAVRQYRKQLVASTKSEMTRMDQMRSACIKLSRFMVFKISQRPQCEAAGVEHREREAKEKNLVQGAEQLGGVEEKHEQTGLDPSTVPEQRRRYRPPMEEKAVRGGVQLLVSLPGIDQDSLSLGVKGRVLSISGTKLSDPYSYFLEKVSLPDALDLAKATSEMEGDLLVVSLPYATKRLGWSRYPSAHTSGNWPFSMPPYVHSGYKGYGLF